MRRGFYTGAALDVQHGFKGFLLSRATGPECDRAKAGIQGGEFGQGVVEGLFGFLISGWKKFQTEDGSRVLSGHGDWVS